MGSGGQGEQAGTEGSVPPEGSVPQPEPVFREQDFAFSAWPSPVSQIRR